MRTGSSPQTAGPSLPTSAPCRRVPTPPPQMCHRTNGARCNETRTALVHSGRSSARCARYRRLRHRRIRRSGCILPGLAVQLSVLARPASRRRDACPGARSFRRRVDGDGAPGARCGDRHHAAGEPRRPFGVCRPAVTLRVDTSGSRPRQCLLSQSHCLLHPLCDLHRPLESAGGVRALGTARRQAADRADAVMDQRRRSGRAGFFGGLCRDRLDFVARAEILVGDFHLRPGRKLVQHRHGGRAAVRSGWVGLAFSAGFAAIDWILSLEPKFWSAIFTYAQAASWFNTGMAVVLLTVALFGWPAGERKQHMADLSQVLLATTMFWAYVEFMQFLIIWEENLKTEIPWYLKRFDSVWHPAIYVSAVLGFAVPFFVLLWAPSKRNRAAVASVCVCILISRLANTWLLVMPEFTAPTPLWLDVAAILALGGAMTLLFIVGLRYPRRLAPAAAPIWTADHG